MSRAAHAHAVRFYVAVALGVLAIGAGVLFRGRWRDLSGATAAGERDASSVSLASWCAPGLEPIAGGGCFALATQLDASVTKPPALLVYLHGRYAPESVADEMERQSRVARMGTARGYSVLTLRGKQGQCTDPQLAAWWCWPSNERNAADGAAFVAGWAPAFAEAERRARPKRRVLLGFSNGGYFASLIAARGLMPLDAVTIAHAGPVAPMTPQRTKPPVLLIDADDDPSSPEILHLDSDLTREAWPHAMVIREGTHALPDWDVDMALTFFDRVHTEPLPLMPPLAPPRAPHPHDAGGPVPDPDRDLAPAEVAAADPADAAVAPSASATAMATATASAPDPAPPARDPTPPAADPTPPAADPPVLDPSPSSP